jgi:hypothetical protein
MSPIEGQDGAAQSVSTGQYFCIIGASLTVFLSCDNIMPQLPQHCDNGQREILIAIEQHQALLGKAFVA